MSSRIRIVALLAVLSILLGPSISGAQVVDPHTHSTQDVSSDVSPYSSESGSVTGTVTDAQGQALPGACVSLTSAIGHQSTSTNANGGYAIVAPAGSYVIEFYGCGVTSTYAIQYFNGSLGGTIALAAASQVIITAGSTTPAINAQLSVGGVISGVVTDSSGTPLAGICVRVTKSGSSGETISQQIADQTQTAVFVTGSDGSYETPVLPPEGFTILFYGCGSTAAYIAHYLGGQSPVSNSQSGIIVGPGNSSSGIDAVMVKGGAITGEVLNQVGAPISEVIVYVYNSQSVPVGKSVTDSSGTYTIAVPPGNGYTILFVSTQLSSTYVQGYYTGTPALTYFAAQAAKFNVVLGSITTAINANLAENGSLKIKVVNNKGRGLSGIGVAIAGPYDSASSAISTMQSSAKSVSWALYETTSNGMLTLPTPPAGDYILEFASLHGSGLVFQYYNGKPGGTQISGDALPVAVQPGLTTNATSVMFEGGILTGKLTNAAGQPIDGGFVTLYGVDEVMQSYMGVFSKSDGSFRIAGIPPGRFRLGYAQCNGTVCTKSNYYAQGQRKIVASGKWLKASRGKVITGIHLVAR